MRGMFCKKWNSEWTQINTLTSENMISDKGSYFVQGGSVSVTFSKIGKNVNFNGEFTTGNAVSSDINAPLFQMPYTAVNQFGGIIVEGSSQRIITYYCNKGAIYTRAALQPNTTYGISGSYIVS